MSPTHNQIGISGCRRMISRAASNAPWMSPSAPIWKSGNVEMWKSPRFPHYPISKFPNLLLVRLRRDEQVSLVPDEVLVAVDRELVVLAHEDRRDRARLFTVAAEDAPRLVDLVGLGVAGTGLDGAVVLRRLEVNR